MIAGCEHGGADMVWRDTVQSIEGNVVRGKMTEAMFLSLSGFLALDIDETCTPPRVRVARRPRPIAINISAGLLSGGVREALARGEDALTELRLLEENGTWEEIEMDDWLRGARMRLHVLKTDALSAWEWKYGGVGFRMMLLKAKMMKGRGE